MRVSVCALIYMPKICIYFIFFLIIHYTIFLPFSFPFYRITDADDDYTVTADQRAALMELESLTWNYPTPQQARGRSSSLSHGAKDASDESDDDDDDESYCKCMR